jgi:hypothetical protein
MPRDTFQAGEDVPSRGRPEPRRKRAQEQQTTPALGGRASGPHPHLHSTLRGETSALQPTHQEPTSPRLSTKLSENCKAVRPANSRSASGPHFGQELLAPLLRLTVDEALLIVPYGNENRARSAPLADDNWLSRLLQFVEDRTELISNVQSVYRAHSVPRLRDYC